ncbi:glycine betaine ABC transporter substrate-binding protein [Streptomyces sp. NPDC005438]|uniref:glycine betaine ABC transporter substrate-binding protein n=1 Tax=Streptomyces sp. NPDC005438 TaxID=3156880 RepID=UPI0033BBB331
MSVRTVRAGRLRRWSVLLLSSSLLAGCGLVSGSPMTDDVEPGSIGKGKPLEGAELTVTSKEFTEQIILGNIMGLAFQAAGATVIDKTNIQGTIGAREAVRTGAADAMYEYTGTGWITHLGHENPIPDSRKMYEAVKKEDARNNVSWLPYSTMNNTYALAVTPKTQKKYGLRTLSDVAKLAKKDPKAVSVCVESEFAARNDGLPGMSKKYGLKLSASQIKKMSAGVIYTQVKGGSCTFGEVYTTDGRIKALNLRTLEDDRKFFPLYNAAPEIYTPTLKKYPEIAKILDPITKKLSNSVAQELNGKVDVDGEDPHQVALDWMVKEGFIKKA